MATRPDYVKIGLFVILGFIAAAAIAVSISVRKLHKETVAFVTYFNEAVTGLDVGSPVKARGVAIGQVGRITFAPDHRMVEVWSNLDIDALVRLGVRPPGLPRTELENLPPDLRAQLGTQGLTGTKYIALDFFDPRTNPPPVLSFPAAPHYIPAARSIQKSLEEAATKAMEDLEELVDSLVRERFSEKLVQTTSHADEVLGQIDEVLKSFRQQSLPSRAAGTIDELHLAADKVNKVLDHLDGERGLVALVQRSVASFGEAGRTATGTTRNLNETLDEIREAAGAIRLLADELERDPDMLLKGRAKRKSP